jgi:Domain of unknown function (DUF6894)
MDHIRGNELLDFDCDMKAWRRCMALYHFDFRDGQHVIDDPEGTELADLTAARNHAREVARELMRNREPKARHCKLQIRDESHQVLSDLLFATVDPTLDHLHAELREQIELLCASLAAFKETLAASRMRTSRDRALVARSSGKPYLVALNGQCL